MWLTAFVLNSFSRARKYIFVDENEIHTATEWIIRRQEEDGHFPTVGRIYNQDIQGGVNNELALTAYVLGALLDANPEKDNIAILKARDYLEQQVLHIMNMLAPCATRLVIQNIIFRHTQQRIRIQ